MRDKNNRDSKIKDLMGDIPEAKKAEKPQESRHSYKSSGVIQGSSSNTFTNCSFHVSGEKISSSSAQKHVPSLTDKEKDALEQNKWAGDNKRERERSECDATWSPEQRSAKEKFLTTFALLSTPLFAIVWLSIKAFQG